MRYFGFLLIGVVAVIAILLLGVLGGFSGRETSQQAIIIPVDPTSVSLENDLVIQQATSQAQMDRLDQELSQQRDDFQARKKALNVEISEATTRLEQLQETQKTLSARLDELEEARSALLTEQQTELQQARDDYLPRQQQLQIQLDALEAELASIESDESDESDESEVGSRE